MTITYLEIKESDLLIADQSSNYRSPITGYGNKLQTRYKLKHKNKLKRVYAICYSNVASHYILENGNKLFLNIY